jgi:hypothetical protein
MSLPVHAHRSPAGGLPHPVDRNALARHISEDDLLRHIVDLARLHHWLIHHCRPARTATGWRTAITGHAGFPDLVLAKPGRLVVAELKSQTGRLSPEQDVWAGMLTLIPGVEAYLWRPADWLGGVVQRVLAAPPEVTG